jgi:serine phosphatase RsbU (regulator of sigma subunit)
VTEDGQDGRDTRTANGPAVPADDGRTDAWDRAPAGLLLLDGNGTVLAANRTFLGWVSRAREEVVGRVRLSELLSVGGRIYWETHLAPLLQVEGRVDEVAVELRGRDGRVPVLLTAVRRGDAIDVVLSSAQERSRYERELLAARGAAEAAEARARSLHEATGPLSAVASTDAVVGALLMAATGPLGALGATYWEAGADGVLSLHSTWGEGADASAVPPLVRAGRSTGARLVHGRAVLPIRGMSGLHGVLSLAERSGPAVDALDMELLSAVGRQAGLALDRAHLYERSALVAHELQQSLLTAETPRDPRFVVATAYRPGVETLEVGGDWHDAFMADDGILSVVVGDVVGRGLGAAIAMGQLRSAVRALAGPRGTPTLLVERLDRFVQQVEAAATATLAYGEVHLDSGRVCYVCAGHLPPVVIPAVGDPYLAWDGRSAPLGLTLPGGRPEGELTLRPGDQLLLYTDGLIERRARPLGDGLDALLAVASELRHLPATELVDTLTARLLIDERSADDVCVLLLRWCGPDVPPGDAPDVTDATATRVVASGRE